MDDEGWWLMMMDDYDHDDDDDDEDIFYDGGYDTYLELYKYIYNIYICRVVSKYMYIPWYINFLERMLLMFPRGALHGSLEALQYRELGCGWWLLHHGQCEVEAV